MVANFNKKQKAETSINKVAFQIAGILFLIIFIVLVVADIKMDQRKRELVSEINNYKKQIAAIQKNNQDLKNSIANQNNPDYIEKIAYEQLGEQKPGEKEVIFVAPPKTTEPVVSPKSYWYSRIENSWNWIKSKF
jgi:cell division protein FtsB